MTVIYQYKVATATFFGFFKLLGKWKGGIYKLVFKETIVFCVLYAAISLVYRYALQPDQRKMFEHVVKYCNRYTNLIPVSFVLGFYVSKVVERWWKQFTNVPWPDSTLIAMGGYLVGQDERSRIMRRTVARYLMCTLIITLRSVSVTVMKRYPTMEHIVETGFMTEEEAILYEKVNCKYNKLWVPLIWATSVLNQAKKEGRIDSDFGYRLLIEKLAYIKDYCTDVYVYDWITIPLVYTQVVTLAVYTFFAACLIGHQFIQNDPVYADLYIPVFTILQFFFYIGWLKVAESLINPFGEDDDDYDMNYLLDRHARVCMCFADELHGQFPPLVKDIHFNDTDYQMPYTEASLLSVRPHFLGSAYNIRRPSQAEQKLVTNIDLSEDHRMRANTGPLRSGSALSLTGAKLKKKNENRSRETLKSNGNNVGELGPLDAMTTDSAMLTQVQNKVDLQPDWVSPLSSSSNETEDQFLKHTVLTDMDKLSGVPQINIDMTKQSLEMKETESLPLLGQNTRSQTASKALHTINEGKSP